MFFWNILFFQNIEIKFKNIFDMFVMSFKMAEG